MAGAVIRPFRIEKIVQTEVNELEGEELSAFRHQELLEAISGQGGTAQAAGTVSEEFLEKQRNDLREAEQVRAELAEMYKAIAETKQEVANLHHNSFSEESDNSASYELDAVVNHTEKATDTILSAAETIDSDATDLIAALKLEGNVNLASDIQDQVVTIFEACNFQDLTGQRITKVVNTLRFIEERISGIMEIWGGLDGFKDVVPLDTPKAQGDAALIHGPANENDATAASQNDIDALFD